MIKYIKLDNSKRLKLFILKHDIHPDSEIGTHSRTALHECAKRGSTECLRVLIKCNANTNAKDKKGNYPLHLAAKYLLKRKKLNSVVAEELITPLKRNLHEHTHDTNSSGTTCWHLLQGLDVKLKLSNQEELISSSASDSDSSSVTSEMEWNEKLAQAHEDDASIYCGKYGDGKYQNQYHETYDEWADRIYNEFNRRHQRKFTQPKNSETKTQSSANAEMKLPPFKPKYPIENNVKISKYNRLFTKKGMINIADLPFSKTSTADEIISLLVIGNENTDKKKILRDAIRKWHPDKFSQMFSGRIDKNEFDDVINIVTHVSQTLLLYGK